MSTLKINSVNTDVYYNLEMIIAISFRTNSDRAIQFRNWAGDILKNYSIRGYVLDKKTMKNGHFLKKKYKEGERCIQY